MRWPDQRPKKRVREGAKAQLSLGVPSPTAPSKKRKLNIACDNRIILISAEMDYFYEFGWYQFVKNN
jgi:hypothetical protein